MSRWRNSHNRSSKFHSVSLALMQHTAEYSGRVTRHGEVELEWSVWVCPSRLRREFRDVFSGSPDKSSTLLLISELSDVSLEELSDLLIIQCFQPTVRIIFSLLL